jgi:hypothetical protein
MKKENNYQSSKKSYQVIERPSTLEMIKPYFISMPVGEFPRRRLRAYIFGAAAALFLSIGADIYSNNLDYKFTQNYMRAEQLKEEAYAARGISGTMLGLLLVTGGLEKLTETIRNRRKKKD